MMILFFFGLQCYLNMEWKLLREIFTSLYCSIIGACLSTSLIFNFASFLELIYWHIFSIPLRDLTYITLIINGLGAFYISFLSYHLKLIFYDRVF